MKTHIRSKDILSEEIDVGIRRKIMGYDSDIMLVQVEFERGGIGKPHKHPHQQISYIVSGKFEVMVNNETEIMNGGDVFIVPSNNLHSVVCLEHGILIDAFSPARQDFLNGK